MSTLSMNQAAAASEAISSQSMAEPPPITLVLPLLRAVLSGSYSLLRLGLRLLLTLAAPLYFIWPIVYAILSPIILVVEVLLNILLFTPLSLLRTVVVALYPIYVFCGVACITGAAVGVLGRYLVTAIQDYLAEMEYFSRPMKSLPATPTSSHQPALRKRKRKSVRIQ